MKEERKRVETRGNQRRAKRRPQQRGRPGLIHRAGLNTEGYVPCPTQRYWIGWQRSTVRPSGRPGRRRGSASRAARSAAPCGPRSAWPRSADRSQPGCWRRNRVVHCTQAISSLTGSHWLLSALLAIGIDAGMVASEVAQVRVTRHQQQERTVGPQARGDTLAAIVLSMLLNGYAFGQHATGALHPRGRGGRAHHPYALVYGLGHNTPRSPQSGPGRRPTGRSRSRTPT